MEGKQAGNTGCNEVQGCKYSHEKWVLLILDTDVRVAREKAKHADGKQYRAEKHGEERFSCALERIMNSPGDILPSNSYHLDNDADYEDCDGRNQQDAIIIPATVSYDLVHRADDKDSDDDRNDIQRIQHILICRFFNSVSQCRQKSQRVFCHQTVILLFRLRKLCIRKHIGSLEL